VYGLYQHRQSNDATGCWSVSVNAILITVTYTISLRHYMPRPLPSSWLRRLLTRRKKWTCSFFDVVESKPNRSRIAIVIAAIRLQRRCSQNRQVPCSWYTYQFPFLVWRSRPNMDRLPRASLCPNTSSSDNARCIIEFFCLDDVLYHVIRWRISWRN